MIAQEELDFFIHEFPNEDPALVNQALDACIKTCSRELWNTMYSEHQYEALLYWMAGWRTRDTALFAGIRPGWDVFFQVRKRITFKSG